MKKNILSIFLERLMAFPLWVKQIIYLRLHQNLSSQLSGDFICVNENEIFHLYKPTISFIGKTELMDKKCGLDTNIYNFLGNINDGLNMLEISLNNFWTMEEISKYFVFCLEQDYIKNPESVEILAMAGFMAGKYRTGEYFKRSGKINVDQLERAIVKQKELVAQGQQVRIAEVMISLGQITEKDTKSLLIIKEEAKKRFILDSSLIPDKFASALEDSSKYKAEIESLKVQNVKLKEQLNRLLAFVKKNAK